MKKVIILLAILITACGNNKKQTLPEEEPATVGQRDTTEVTEADASLDEPPYTTPILENAGAYFKANNKYKDWDEKNRKMVIIKCVVEKDSTTSDVIARRSCGNEKLDKEAIRLIEDAKVIPGKDARGEAVRSRFTIVVDFPPK